MDDDLTVRELIQELQKLPEGRRTNVIAVFLEEDCGVRVISGAIWIRLQGSAPK